MTLFAPGDVVRYRPSQHHCREGMAIAEERSGRIMLFDTFWASSGDRHVLTHDEIATAELEFRISDYDELDQSHRSMSGVWKKYAPADRQTITSQHGLQHRYFIRKGAAEDWPTQIDNARQELEEREREADSAQRRVEWAREDLAKVIASAESAGASA